MREQNHNDNSFSIISPEEIENTYKRISSYIHQTPMLSSSILDQRLGHEVIFKAENFQKIGAFKSRGAINKILKLKEEKNFTGKITAFSSGNHSQAIAWAAKKFGIKAKVFITESASNIKIETTRSYGADVVITKTRKQAEEQTFALANNGYHLVHAYDDDDIILGQGTAAYEALKQFEPNAIFAPCGGGGLLSGSYLAKQLLAPKAKIFGVEPKNANDASISYKSDNIYGFDDSPDTIADGARALSLSPRTFHYIKQTDGIIEATEGEICYWVQQLSYLLKILIEPTAALSMAGAYHWLKSQKTKQKVLVILSGGNISPETSSIIWKKNYL